MVLEFTDSDIAYLEWISQNSDGFILNSRRKITRRYMVLHAAHCPHVTKYKKYLPSGGFTERNYIKVCSPQRRNLLEWVRKHKTKDFSSVCKHCIPAFDKNEQV